MFLRAVTNVETHEPVAALTFDDGPHPVYTPCVLSILAKYGARATFFMSGEAASKYPEIVRMVSRAGHVIGNHSWDHQSLPSIRSRLRRLKQMRACAQAIAPYSKRLFRPPYGAHNTKTLLDALLLGYSVILWSVSAQDWIPQTADEIAQKIINRITPGSIFLLHDDMRGTSSQEIQWDREPMLEGLEKALALLKQKIHFMTVPELLRVGRPVNQWPLS